MGELYRLDFPNGKSYIGITTKTASERFACHKNFARGTYRRDDAVVYKAWRKHGAPKLVVLATLEDRELASTEIRAIAVYGTLIPRGYNMTTGGDVSPMLDGRIAAKVSASMKGRRRSLASREKQSATLMGNQHLKGHVHSEASRKKMSDARRGVKFSPERNAALSKATKGVPKSAAHTAKMPEAARKWIAAMRASDPERYKELVDKRNQAIRASWKLRKEQS